MHTTHIEGHYPELVQEIQLAKDIYPMKCYDDWLLRDKDKTLSNAENGKEWNGVSIMKLLTGRL